MTVLNDYEQRLQVDYEYRHGLIDMRLVTPEGVITVMIQRRQQSFIYGLDKVARWRAGAHAKITIRARRNRLREKWVS